MDYSRTILELQLTRVDLDPLVGERAGERGLMVSLITPRPMIAERTHNRVLEFEEGQCDLKGRPFHEKILFKETVQGPFGIRVALSDRDEPTVLEEWLKDLAEYGLRAAGTYFAADVPTFLRTFAGRPFRLAGDAVNDSGRTVTFAGVGGHSFTGSAPRPRRKLTIPLLAPEDRLLSKSAAGPRRSGRAGARRTPVRSSKSISRGTAVGSVELSARLID